MWRATPDGIFFRGGRAMKHIMQSQRVMPSTDTLSGEAARTWSHGRAMHQRLLNLLLLLCFFAFPSSVSSTALFFSLSISGARGLPSGLCRSSWQAPFEAFHSCSSPQDCALLPWLCSINNSPPASLLPPSSFCSSQRSIFSRVRGGSVCACVCVCLCVCVCGGREREWERERQRERVREAESEWVRDGEDVNMCVRSLLNAPLFWLLRGLDFSSLRVRPLKRACVYAYSHTALASVCVHVRVCVCVCVYIRPAHGSLLSAAKGREKYV